jgi:hypothetical protein
MKCFVHLVDLEPEPQEVDSPEEAISTAIKYLEHMSQGHTAPDKLEIKWRRDDFYPDNFHNFTQVQLIEELTKNGYVELQLVEFSPDFLPIMGETVTILTEEREKEDRQEAMAAFKQTVAEPQILSMGSSRRPRVKRRTPSKL